MNCHKCRQDRELERSIFCPALLCAECRAAEVCEADVTLAQVLIAAAKSHGNDFFPGLSHLCNGFHVFICLQGRWSFGTIKSLHLDQANAVVNALGEEHTVPLWGLASSHVIYEPSRVSSALALPEGSIECPGCNGYGSSFQDPIDIYKCTFCYGTGLLKPKAKE